MKIADDGKNEIVTPLPVKRQAVFQGNPVHEITNNYQNMYLQQQMNELSLMLKDTLNVVIKIEKGQKSDRVALLESGRQQVLLALSQKDDETRKQALLLGANNISTAQSQFLEAFKDKVRDFEPIPESKVKQFIYALGTKDYLSSKDDEYRVLEDYFHLYLESTEMLAGCYLVMGDRETAEKVFELAHDKVAEIDFSNVKTIEYAHKNKEIVGLHRYSTDFIDEQKSIAMNKASKYDCLEITVSGDKLLEMIENA